MYNPTYYKAMFCPRDEEYQDYTLPGTFDSPRDAVVAVQADIIDNQGRRELYNAPDYYDIREFSGFRDEDDGDLVGAWTASELRDELPEATLGSKVAFKRGGKRPRLITGQITNIYADWRQRYFVVVEFNKNGTLSSSISKKHYLKLSCLYTIRTF